MSELSLKKKELELARARLRLAKAQGGITVPESDQMTYEEASKGDVAMEAARSVARGGVDAAEFLGDIGDVGRAVVSARAGGRDGDTILETLNPFGPPDSGDISRKPIWESPAAQHMTAENIERGGSMPLDMLKTGSEYVLPVMTGGAGKRMIAETIGTGTGAAIGEQIGELLGDTWVAEAVGAIGGGLSATAVASLGSKIVNYLPHKSGEQLTPDEVTQVVKVLLDNSENPQQAVKNFEAALERGEVGTIADFMADPDIYNIEATARANTPAERAQQRVAAARGDQIVEGVSAGFGTGDPGAPQGLAQARVAQAVEGIQSTTRSQRTRADQNLQQGLDASVGRVDAADTAVDQAVVTANQAEDALSIAPVSLQSENLASTYNRVEKAVRDNDVQPLWDAFDAAGDIDTKYAADAIDQVIDSLAPIDQTGIRREFAAEIAAIKALPDIAPARDVHRIVSTIKTKMANVDEAKPFQKYMVEVNKGLENIIETSPAGPAYTAARDAERQINQRFKPPGVGKARRKAEGEVLGPKLLKQLEQGAVTAREILQSGSPEIIDAAKATIRAIAKRDGVDEKFIKKYGELLDGFGLRDELTGIATLRETAESMDALASQAATAERTVQTGLNKARTKLEGTTGDSRSANIAKLRASTLGQFADNPKAVVRNIFKSDTPERELNSLLSAVGRGKTERNNLKRHVGDYFLEQIKRTDGVVDPATVDEFERLRPMLESNDFMDASEIAAISEFLGMTSATKLRKAATTQEIEKLNPVQNLGASAIAAMAMTAFPGSSLIMAGAVRRFVKDNMLHANDPAIRKALQDMAENPALFADAVKKYKPPATPDNVPAFMNKALRDIVESRRTMFTPAVIVAPRGEEENAQR